MDYLEEFLSTKELEGRSDGTLRQYNLIISKLLDAIHKNIQDITTNDLRKYLINYKNEREVSNVTLDNIRRSFTSFFNWLHNEGIIPTNPAKSVNKIKTPKLIKKPYTEEEMETLKENAELRELVIIELLYSSGMRVGELAKLNIKDIDFEQKKAKVWGKGDKEREVYFNTHSLRILNKYLNYREDDCEALIVTKRTPYSRLKENSIENIMSQLGKKCGIKCHCHRFRRTFATNLLGKGVPLEQVSKMLGHSKLETTMIYCEINENDMKRNYERFI